MIVASVPVDLGRDEARDLARQELSKPSYERDTPVVTRVLRWIVEQIERILDAATGAFSSRLGIAIVVVIVVVFAAVVVLRAGPMARSGADHPGPVLPNRRWTAAQYREAADTAAARGDWNTAVVERFRAVVAGLEERGVLDARAGRTADEAAREAATELGDIVLSDVPDPMRAGAVLFDSVRYGAAAAVSADDLLLRELDRAVAAARPRPAQPGGPLLAVPR